MAEHITQTPDGLRFVKAKGGTKIHLLPQETMVALCGHEPKSRFSNRFHNPRAGWWLVKIDMVHKPTWCEKCQQARPPIRCPSAASRDAVAAAGERLRLALLDQRSTLIPADDLQVVTSPASGAHEVQPEAVDVGLDLAETCERRAAADAGEEWSAGEHWIGVRPEHDGKVTTHG